MAVRGADERVRRRLGDEVDPVAGDPGAREDLTPELALGARERGRSTGSTPHAARSRARPPQAPRTRSDSGARSSWLAHPLPTPLLLILFRQKYPVWWYEWNRELLRFTSRVSVYLALLDDRYPSTDEQQSVDLELDYPDVRRDLLGYAFLLVTDRYPPFSLGP